MESVRPAAGRGGRPAPEGLRRATSGPAPYPRPSRHRSGSPTTTSAASFAAASRPAAPESTSDGSASTPRARCTASEARARSRLAVASVLDRPGEPKRAPQAPRDPGGDLDRRPVVLGTGERNEDGPGLRTVGARREDADVTRCGEQRRPARTGSSRSDDGASTSSRSTSCSLAIRTRSDPGTLARERGGARRHTALVKRLAALACRARSRQGDPLAERDQLSEDELTRRPAAREARRSRARSSKRAGSSGATRIERSGGATGSWSRTGSCWRIAFSSACSVGVGSIPRSSTSFARHDRYTAEGVGLSPRAVQREHELARRRLAQRVLVDERLELCDHVPMPTESEIGVDPHLGRRDPQLLEAGDGCLGEVLVGELDERGTPPQRERASQPLGGDPRPSTSTAWATSCSNRRRSSSVVAHPEHVAGCLRDDRLAALPERLPQLRDAHP